jgi:hypothetical protein
MTASGYAHPAYLQSLAEFGRPIAMPASKSWALMRTIPQTAHHDAIGGYPFFFCGNWNGLAADLEALSTSAVSFSITTDPFAALDPDRLTSIFDVVTPFKDHFIADLSQPPESFVSRSHQETVRRALRKVDVRVAAEPTSLLVDWIRLFAFLAKRHAISGMRAFSDRAFALQLAVPGMVAFEASDAATGEIIGMDLWYVQDDIAYGHLVAFNERGYALRASYATKWHVLKHFFGKVRYVHLSAAAGMTSQITADDGLATFKRGWATQIRRNYFCGKVLDRPAYDELVKAFDAKDCTFFPAYRKGQF